MREPIELDPTRALGSVIRQMIQSEGIRVALAAFCDGANLQGDWELHVVGGVNFQARLVPVEVPANGDTLPFVKHGPGKRKRA